MRLLELLDPLTGQTRRSSVYARNKARLYRYPAVRRYRTPLLFVPNLGISRPWIFDLLPGRSLAEYLTGQGFDFYLLDWGVFGAEDDDLTFEECVTEILPRVCQKVRDTSGSEDFSVLGYCMGAALAASLAATRPELPMKAFIDMAGPIDFARAGLLSRWLDARFFDVDRIANILGPIPPALIVVGGTLLRPMMGLSMLLEPWSSAGSDESLREIAALAKWVREFVGIPRDFFRQWVRDFYQENKLYRGELRLGERTARLEAIRCPVLAVAAREDPVAPPESVRPLLDVIGSRDRTWLQLPGSHLSLLVGPVASGHFWPALSAWLASRS